MNTRSKNISGVYSQAYVRPYYERNSETTESPGDVTTDRYNEEYYRRYPPRANAIETSGNG